MIKRRLLITCKEATLYIEKKEGKAITLKERIKLLIHMLICKFCRLFERQNKFINLQLKHYYIEEVLSNQEKDKIDQLIQHALNSEK